MSQPYPICVIAGDGIGPEVVEAELAVLEATGLAFDFSHFEAGDDCLAKTGEAMPQATLDGALASRAVVFGAAGNSAAEVIIRLRNELKTYANLRPSRAYEGVECLHPGTDMMIVRENSECLYVGLESQPDPDTVHATRLITRKGCLRIARCAFEYARDNGENKVIAAHKSNVLKKGDGLFLECCRQASSEFPGIELEEALVDSLAMRMVMDPSLFAVIVTTNLFGDILSDLAAGLIGGLGLCPSANLGDDHALFEPVHGSAPDIAGTGQANPSAAILCGAMMLRHLGEMKAAQAVETALEGCLRQGLVTPDLGGKLTTMEMARAVIDQMEK